MKIKWLYLLWFGVFILFFIKALFFLDPDFGWHYQMGKIITTTGVVPKLDQFSYTMPYFKFVDVEWLINVIIYNLYNTVGVLGLSVLWSIFALVTLKLSVSRVVLMTKISSRNKTLFDVCGLLIGGGLIFSQFGVRTQVISWLFLAVLLFVLSLKKPKNIRLILPVFFLVWANLHGAFVLGLVVFGVNLVMKASENKQLSISEIFIFGMSILVTLINPYGINLWKEVLDTFFSSSLRGQISEWQLGINVINISYLFLSAFSMVTIYLYRKYFQLAGLWLLVIFYILSLTSAYTIPFFAIMSLAYVPGVLNLVEKKVQRIPQGKKRFQLANYIFFGLTVFLIVVGAISPIVEASKLSEDLFYPKKAIRYISQNLPTGQIFSVYNWGGYLIWKLSDNKVFIDGRMAHWPGILDYQSKIILGEMDYKETFDKYNIKMVLWPVSDKRGEFVNRIKNDGWSIVYSDQVSQVLTKN